MGACALPNINSGKANSSYEQNLYGDDDSEMEFTLVTSRKDKKRRNKQQGQHEHQTSSDEEREAKKSRNRAENNEVRSDITTRGEERTGKQPARGAARPESDGRTGEQCTGGATRPTEDNKKGNPIINNDMVGERRPRLYFPPQCKMTFQEKTLWTIKLGREHKSFLPLMKEGKYKPYITVGSREAVDMLTTSGYDGVTMTTPNDDEKKTKVIIFNYPVWLDPDYITDDSRFLWVQRHKIKGVERSQVVALIQGEVPDRIFVTGIGYKYLAPYREPEDVCLNCSRWGHRAWSCKADPRCRFCGKGHHSSSCRQKINENIRVMPRCCNCRGDHNARSWECPLRPKSYKPTERNNPYHDHENHNQSPHHDRETQQPRYVPAPPPPSHENPWTGRRTETTTATTRVETLQQSQTPSTENGGRVTTPPQSQPITTPNNQASSTGAQGRQCDQQEEDRWQETKEMFRYIRELGDKLESLEKKVNKITQQRTNVNTRSTESEVEKTNKDKNYEVHERENKEGENDQPKLIGKTACEVKIKGKNITLNQNKFMTNGVSNIEMIMSKLGNNEEKKENLASAWTKLQYFVEEFANYAKEITESVRAEGSINGR